MSRSLYRFGSFEFDPGPLELRRDGEPVDLQPQPAAVLHLFLRNPGKLLTRAEIQDAIWPNEPSRVTRDQGLNTCISQIRRALGDGPGAAGHIRTYPRRGYRFRVPVHKSVRDRTGPAARPSRSGISALGLATVLVASVALWFVGSVSDRSGRASPVGPGTPTEARPDSSARLAYLKGVHHLERASLAGVHAALPHLQEAVVLDDRFPAAHAALATALYWAGRTESARTTALRALELDPRQPDPHVVLARIALERDFDWDGARRHFERAVALAPERARYQHAYAHYFALLGRHRQALARLRHTLELDPIGPSVAGDVGRMFYWAGRYEEAVTHCETSQELSSPETQARAERCLLDALVELGRIAESLVPAARIMRLAGAREAEIETVLSGPPESALRSYREWSLQPENRREALGGDDPFALARVYADLGEPTRALDALERAYRLRSHGLLTLRVEPRLRALRGDPRFRALVRRVGFPEPVEDVVGPNRISPASYAPTG